MAGNAGSELGLTSRVARLNPDSVLVIVLLEIFLLLALMIASLSHVVWLPSAGYVLGTVVPVVAPWAGALGGATFALYGLVFHWSKYRTDLDDKQTAAALHQRWTFNSIYLISAVLGGLFGTLAALIVVYLTKSISIGDGIISPTGKIVIAIIAFVVGFHQQYFRTLMHKVAGIIFATPETPGQNGANVPPANADAVATAKADADNAAPLDAKVSAGASDVTANATPAPTADSAPTLMGSSPESMAEVAADPASEATTDGPPHMAAYPEVAPDAAPEIPHASR